MKTVILRLNSFNLIIFCSKIFSKKNLKKRKNDY